MLDKKTAGGAPRLEAMLEHTQTSEGPKIVFFIT
jgi:hypothetical protein